MKHTILGAGGSIGNALTFELLKDNQQVRLVSRRNYSIPGTESVKADITSYEQTLQSVSDSDIVYLCVGLPYNSTIWADKWPKIMQNTMDACKQVGAKLIFFDNVYMYGKVDGKMTETTPYNPCSKKGEIRAKIATMLEREIEKKNLEAIIARSADFYGPYAANNSMPFILVLEKLMKSKKAQWMGNVETTHSFSYTLDCAKALQILSKRNENFNQVWHLPTQNPGITGNAFIEIAAKELDMPNNIFVLKAWMIKLFGLFNRTVGELHEMLYQNNFDYYFDSTKFNNHFNYKPITYEEGIKETIGFYKK